MKSKIFLTFMMTYIFLGCGNEGNPANSSVTKKIKLPCNSDGVCYLPPLPTEYEGNSIYCAEVTDKSVGGQYPTLVCARAYDLFADSLLSIPKYFESYKNKCISSFDETYQQSNSFGSYCKKLCNLANNIYSFCFLEEKDSAKTSLKEACNNFIDLEYCKKSPDIYYPGTCLACLTLDSLNDYSLKNQVTFGWLYDSRDGHTYQTITYKGLNWMAENLNYAYLQPTADLDSSSFCYDDEPKNCDKYGRLYLMSAALDSAGLFTRDAAGCGERILCSSVYLPIHGVCPAGWRLPSESDLEKIAFLDLRRHEEWLDYTQNFRTMELPFGALPAGMRVSLHNPQKARGQSVYAGKGYYTGFWIAGFVNEASVVNGGYLAPFVTTEWSYDSYKFGREPGFIPQLHNREDPVHEGAYSIRCIKD